MKRITMAIALMLSNCMNPSGGPAEGEGSAPAADPIISISQWGRELGTLTAIYPIPNPDGSYSLEFRMTKDTVRVDLDSLQSFVSDDVGKALIRSTREPFYTRNERCFFNPKKNACLEFREAGAALSIAPQISY